MCQKRSFDDLGPNEPGAQAETKRIKSNTVFRNLRVVNLTNNDGVTSIIPKFNVHEVEEGSEELDPTYDFSALAQKVAETFELETNSFVMGFFDTILLKEGELYFEEMAPPNYYCKLPLKTLTDIVRNSMFVFPTRPVSQPKPKTFTLFFKNLNEPFIEGEQQDFENKVELPYDVCWGELLILFNNSKMNFSIYNYDPIKKQFSTFDFSHSPPETLQIHDNKAYLFSVKHQQQKNVFKH